MCIKINKITVLCICTISISLLLSNFIIYGSILFYITIFIIAGFLIYRNFDLSATYKEKELYFFMVIMHIALLLCQAYLHNLPMSGADWTVYVNNARNLLARENAVRDIINPLTFGEIIGDMYERLCAIVYYFYGYNQKYMYYISFLAAECTFYNIFKSAEIVSQEHNTKIPFFSALVFYITPLEMVYSVDFLREMVIQAIFSLSMLFLIRYLYNISNVFYPVIICSIILSVFHSGFVGVLMGYIAIYIFLNKKSKTIDASFVKIMILLGVILIIYISPLWNVIARRFSDVDSLSDLGNRVNTTSKYAVGTTDYISAPSSSFDVIIQTPIRIIYYLASPLPWQVSSLGTFIAMMLDGTVRWILCCRIINLLISAKTNKHINLQNKSLIYAALIIIGCTTLIFSWGTNNYGTAMRHRTSLYPLEIMLYITIWNMEKKGESKNEQSFGECNYSDL